MKVKITHDGSGACTTGTTIVNADTGEPITMVRRIEIVLDADDGPHAIIHIENPMLSVVIDARVEREQTLIYDPDDTGSLDDAIAVLQEQRAARERI